MTNLLRRSELAVPASNDNMFDKAAGCGADLVFLDLEDAVPPAFKEESRGKAISALNDLDWGAHRAGGADQRPGHRVVPRRRHRGGEPGRSQPRHHHRPQGAQRPRRVVGGRSAHATRIETEPGQANSARGADRRGGGVGQRRGDRGGQSAPRRPDLRGGRLLAVPGRPGGHQLRPAGRISRRILGLRAQQGDRRRAHRRHRRDRRAVPRLPRPLRVRARRAARVAARLHRQVGDPPRPGARRQRRLRSRPPTKSPAPKPMSPPTGKPKPRGAGPSG